MTQDKSTLHARISNQAAQGLSDFCTENGITVTAFIEVLGIELSRGMAELPVKESREETRKRMIQEARKIDVERRSRK